MSRRALASSLRKRLFSASSSETGREGRAPDGVRPAGSTSALASKARRQRPSVAGGIPKRRADEEPFVLSFLLSIQQEITTFLLYVETGQGHSVEFTEQAVTVGKARTPPAQ